MLPLLTPLIIKPKTAAIITTIGNDAYRCGPTILGMSTGPLSRLPSFGLSSFDWSLNFLGKFVSSFNLDDAFEIRFFYYCVIFFYSLKKFSFLFNL